MAFDPATISAGADIAGLLAALIGTPSKELGSADNVTNVNQQQTDAMTQLLGQLFSQTQGQTDQYAGQAGQQYGALSQQGQAASAQANQLFGQGMGNAQNSYNTLTSLQGQLANQPGFDTSAGMRDFQSQTPIFQDLAQDARSQALGAFETPAASQALFQADQNVQGAANNFAGLGGSTSGAAAAAAAQGAQAPLAQLAVDRANVGTSAYQNTLNPLLQQGYSQANQNAQFDYSSGINQLMSLIGAAQGQGQLGLGQASSANQAQSTATGQQQAGAQGMAGLSSLYAGLQGQALNGLTQLGAPEYWQPTYQAGSGFLGFLGQ